MHFTIFPTIYERLVIIIGRKSLLMFGAYKNGEYLTYLSWIIQCDDEFKFYHSNFKSVSWAEITTAVVTILV